MNESLPLESLWKEESKSNLSKGNKLSVSQKTNILAIPWNTTKPKAWEVPSSP